MPRLGFPRSPRDTRKTQDTPIPAVLGKTLTDYPRLQVDATAKSRSRILDRLQSLLVRLSIPVDIIPGQMPITRSFLLLITGTYQQCNPPILKVMTGNFL